MAKGAGDNRVSTWRKAGTPLTEDLYFSGGKRQEYVDLDETHKSKIKEVKRRIQKEMYQKLRDVETPQVIDDGKVISIHYSNAGIKHFCNDAMIRLSGKYFSETSMMNIDKIIAKSTYVPSSHSLYKARTDGREMWFKYKDADGRGIYFKVSWNSSNKYYELYSVTDVL